MRPGPRSHPFPDSSGKTRSRFAGSRTGGPLHPDPLVQLVRLLARAAASELLRAGLENGHLGEDEDYEGARRLLAHLSAETTYQNYEEMEMLPAVERFDRAIEAIRGKGLFKTPVQPNAARAGPARRGSVEPRRMLAAVLPSTNCLKAIKPIGTPQEPRPILWMSPAPLRTGGPRWFER